MSRPYFPMFVDLSDKKVIVVGAGTIAKRRIRVLAEFTDHLVVIAPEVNKELLDMEAAGQLTILRKRYEREDIYDAAVVIAATNDTKTNNDIYSACKCLGIQVNVYSDKNKCDFFFPGIVKKDHVVVGVTASGKDRKEAKTAAGKIKEIL